MSNYSIPISVNYADYLKTSIKNWSSYKKQTRATLDHWDSIGENPLSASMSANVHNCGSWLYFRHYDEIEKSTLHKARFCKKDKLCPACAMRRATKQVDKVMGQLRVHPDLIEGSWYLIVLPVIHTAEEDFMTVFNRLQTGLKGINKAMRNVRSGQGTENYFADNFDGIMYSIEETKTQNGWNIHANLLCRSSKPLTGLIMKPSVKGKKRASYWHPDAVETWRNLTSSINVSISPINAKDPEALYSNLREVFKYSLKFQDLSPDDLLIAYRCLYGRRLLGTMGTLRNLKTDVDLNGDDVENQMFTESFLTFVSLRSGYRIEWHRRGKVYSNGFAIYEADPYDDELMYPLKE